LKPRREVKLKGDERLRGGYGEVMARLWGGYFLPIPANTDEGLRHFWGVWVYVIKL